MTDISSFFFRLRILSQPMKNNSHNIKDEFRNIALFVGLIWLVFVFDLILPLEKLGLIPRSLQGLIGIVSMTFLHGSFAHIIGNTLPLVTLLALLAGSRANSKEIVIMIVLLGGVLLWLFGRSQSIHIGASLLIFGLASFLMVSGFIEKRTVPLLISLFVAFSYGGTLFMGMLPWQEGVSWDGHLFGAIAGVAVAYGLLRVRG